MLMLTPKLSLAALVLALALSSAPVIGAEDSHSHAGHGGGLTLDHGRKWQTDAPLRAGMAAIRADMARALEPLHGGRFTPKDYDALANSIGGHIETIARECRLPAETDAQLHLILAEIINGTDAMRGKSHGRMQGAVAIIKALDSYPIYFDHPGWAPLSH